MNQYITGTGRKDWRKCKDSVKMGDGKRISGYYIT